MTKMTQQEASAALSEAVSLFEVALKVAEEIATEYGLGFYICPAYGAGATFYGTTSNWREQGWQSSTQSCM
jgi:hypothetical protein